MVTLSTFNTPEEAHLLRLRLEAAGIPAAIVGENLANVTGETMLLTGGAKVAVRDEDFAAAQRIISAAAPHAAKSAASAPRCPACHSTHVEPATSWRTVVAAIAILFMLPLPFGNYPYSCLDCQYRWREQLKARKPARAGGAAR